MPFRTGQHTKTRLSIERSSIAFSTKIGQTETLTKNASNFNKIPF